jgi:hypothetical protein
MDPFIRGLYPGRSRTSPPSDTKFSQFTTSRTPIRARDVVFLGCIAGFFDVVSAVSVVLGIDETLRMISPEAAWMMRML